MKMLFWSGILSVFFGFFTPEAEARAWSRTLVQESSGELDPQAILEQGLEDLIADPAQAVPDGGARARVRILIERKPKDFEHEFGLLIIDGKIERAFLVSTAVEGKEPILGTYRLGIPRVNGKPWPWRTSSKYQNSPMYWALQISGGFFIHSSPHYGNLGAPASMGCIRTSLPDAMELFHAVVNRSARQSGSITLHEGVGLADHSPEAQVLSQALRDSGWTMDRLQEALARSRQEIEAVSTGDLEYAPGIPAEAHVRPLSESLERISSFPTCAGEDCWKLYRRTPRIVRLKPYVQYSHPASTAYETREIPGVWSTGMRFTLDTVLGGKIGSIDPFLIQDVRVALNGDASGIQVRICDQGTRVCSRARGPASGQKAESVFPMYQVSHRLGSSSNLILEVVSGSGTISALQVRYFD
jgi:hypothetical protein